MGTSLSKLNACDTTSPKPNRLPFVFHPLVVCAASAIAGSISATRFWPATCVALLWLIAPLLLKRRGAWALALVCLLLFFLQRARAESALHDYKRSYHAWRSLFEEPKRCAGQGTITTSPTMRLDGAQSVLVYSARFDTLDCTGKQLLSPGQSVEVRLNQPIDHAVFAPVRGDVVDAVVQLAPQRLFRNAALDDPWPNAARRGVILSGSVLVAEQLQSGRGAGSWIDRLRAHVRARIIATYSPLVMPLGRALVLGESDLNPNDAGAFRDSGLLHLLAVSGTHLVIFVLTLVHLLDALCVRCTYFSARWDIKRVPALIGAVLSIFYADFSGGSGSAWRAAYMLFLVTMARACGFRLGGAAALGGSLLVGLALEPLASSDLSFLLSALATSGLIGLGQPLARLLLRGPLRQQPLLSLGESLLATVASTIPCAPVLALMDDSMTWAALFANVVAAPLGELIALPACLLHSLMAPLPQLEQGLAQLGSGALFGVRYVALQSAAVQSAQFAVPFPAASDLALLLSMQLLGFLSMIGVVERGWHARPWLVLSLILALLLMIVAFLVGAHSSSAQRASAARSKSARPRSNTEATPLRPPQLHVTALDVGQGDALLIDFPNGQHALVDGGGFATGLPDTAQRVLLPVLRARHIRHLDLMVLSHAHPDHMTGLLGVAASIAVDELWIPSLDAGSAKCPATPPKSLDSLYGLSKLVALVCVHGGKIRASSALCGDTLAKGGIQVRVLAPCVRLDPALGLNDGSLVLHLRYGQRSALLTGDIEARGEAWLLENEAEALQADLLKVAHHGSDTSSSPEFVAAVRARFAFISAGVRNRFRHPRPATLATLNAQKIAVFRTDLQGSLTFATDGHAVRILTFDPAPDRLAP